MQLCPVKVADTIGGLVCGGHGDKAVATSPRALGVGHHLGSDNLQGEKKMTNIIFTSNIKYYSRHCE